MAARWAGTVPTLGARCVCGNKSEYRCLSAIHRSTPGRPVDRSAGRANIAKFIFFDSAAAELFPAPGPNAFRHAEFGELHLVFHVFEITATPGIYLVGYTAQPQTSSAQTLSIMASWVSSGQAQQR